MLRVRDADQVPMVLVGNKYPKLFYIFKEISLTFLFTCDIDNEREVSTAEGQNLAKEWSIPFFEASAKTRINVDEVFKAICYQIGNLW